MSESFVDGPAITTDLAAWFEGEGKGKRVQLPVVVAISPLGLKGGHVGMTDDATSDGALLLKLDDGAMAVGLGDQLRPVCEGKSTCAVWLEGTWGANVGGMPSFGGPDMGPKKHPFAVRKVVGKVGAGDGAVVRVVE